MSPLSFFSRRRKDPKLDEIATQPSVFDDKEQAQYCQPHPNYEKLHRSDPNFTWTWGEEKALIRRLDWRIVAWGWAAYLSLNADPSSLIQAQSDGFLKDLHMNTNGRSSFLACRAIIGLLQGGFLPDMILYMSYYFKGAELPLRLALFWTADRIKDVLIPLPAFGVLHLRGHEGKAGWRWLFLIEGLVTLCIGVWSAFMMAPSPTQTKAWFRPKGWFTEHEEKILVNRILRDDPSKWGMHNRQAVNWKLLWQSLKDYDLWPLYIVGLTFSIAPGPPKAYLTLSLKVLGFSTFQTNLLSVPPQAATSVTLVLLTWISEKIDQRAYLGLFCQLWIFPCLVSLVVLPILNMDKWATYSLIVVLLAYPTAHPMQAAWCSRNSNSVPARAVSAALYNMASQLSAIIGANVYRDDDNPAYKRGNRILLGITCWNIVLYLLVKAYYTFRNRMKERKWSSMSPEKRLQYLETTTDEGNKRLDFRFVS